MTTKEQLRAEWETILLIADPNRVMSVNVAGIDHTLLRLGYDDQPNPPYVYATVYGKYAYLINPSQLYDDRPLTDQPEAIVDKVRLPDSVLSQIDLWWQW